MKVIEITKKDIPLFDFDGIEDFVNNSARVSLKDNNKLYELLNFNNNSYSFLDLLVFKDDLYINAVNDEDNIDFLLIGDDLILLKLKVQNYLRKNL